MMGFLKNRKGAALAATPEIEEALRQDMELLGVQTWQELEPDKRKELFDKHFKDVEGWRPDLRP